MEFSLPLPPGHDSGRPRPSERPSATTIKGSIRIISGAEAMPLTAKPTEETVFRVVLSRVFPPALVTAASCWA